jgi:hypothetical protein
MINIYTVKWGDKYSSEHVNKILEQCKQHITSEFKFYCITENPADLYSEITVIPLPEDNYYEKWWNKLHLFDRRITRQQGEKLFLDLDIKMQHNIDELVEIDPEDCLVFLRTHWHNLEKMREDTKDNPRKYTDLNSSILRWNDNLDVDKITKFVRDYADQMFFYYRGLDNLFGHQRRRLLNIKFFPDGVAYSYNYGYMYPNDIEEHVFRKDPLICLFDSMERPQDVKL